MLTITAPTARRLALPLAAALTLAACGGDERLTRAEYAERVEPEIARVSESFTGVFQAIGRAQEDERVPAAALRRLAGAADTERAVAGRLAALEPPQELERTAARLVAGARRQADQLDRLATRKGAVTVAELADAVEQGATAEPLRDLARRGVIQPPPQG